MRERWGIRKKHIAAIVFWIFMKRDRRWHKKRATLWLMGSQRGDNLWLGHGAQQIKQLVWSGHRRRRHLAREGHAAMIPLLAMPNSVHKTQRRLPPDTSADGDANADADANADQVTFYWRLRARRPGTARLGHFLLFRGMKAAAGPHMDNWQQLIPLSERRYARKFNYWIDDVGNCGWAAAFKAASERAYTMHMLRA